MKFTAIFIASIVATANASYTLLDRPLAERAQLCLSNSADCSNFCYAKTSVNTCDPATLKWDCACASDAGTVLPSFNQFTVAIQQCQGELLDCVNACLSTTTQGSNYCSAQCKNEKKCATSSAVQNTNFRVDSTQKATSVSPPASTSDAVSDMMEVVSGASILLLAMMQIVA